MKAVIDVHTLKDSQNGFDNGGRAMDVVWTSTSATNPAGVATFIHWPVRAAYWIGTYNRENNTYTDINYDNIDHALQVTLCFARCVGNVVTLNCGDAAGANAM